MFRVLVGTESNPLQVGAI